MNNKASKRLLAASVASLMLVVAFCGFTYAGDDADAVNGKSNSSAYVKNITVAVNDDDDDDGYDNDGDMVSFKIVTTQNVATGLNLGISHSGKWTVITVGDGGIDNNVKTLTSDPDDSQGAASKVLIGVSTTNNTHTFTVVGKIIDLDSDPNPNPETVKLRYDLVSGINGSTHTQSIYYDIVIEVVRALPNEGVLKDITGYVGVEFVKNAAEWLDYLDDNVETPSLSGLKFYASKLPNGLSMDVNGTISGVPKIKNTHVATVNVYNETGFFHTFSLSVKVEDRIASLDASVKVEEGNGVREVSEGRYIVVQGTEITVKGQVTGFRGGSMSIDTDYPATTYDDTTGTGTESVKLTETGERLIKVAYEFDMDDDGSMPAVTIVDYITVVVIDVVEDATTGIGLAAGSVSSTNVDYTAVTS